MGKAERRTRILQVLADAGKPLAGPEIVNACLPDHRPHKWYEILPALRDAWIWGGYHNELLSMQGDGLIRSQWMREHLSRKFYLPRDANLDGSYYPRPE